MKVDQSLLFWTVMVFPVSRMTSSPPSDSTSMIVWFPSHTWSRLTERASNKVLVRRFDSGDELTVNYKKLLAGTRPDIELTDGDLIIVKESFF